MIEVNGKFQLFSLLTEISPDGKVFGMKLDQGILSKKLQQTLVTYIQVMVSSSKEILEDVGDLPYMLCKVELQDRDKCSTLYNM